MRLVEVHGGRCGRRAAARGLSPAPSARQLRPTARPPRPPPAFKARPAGAGGGPTPRCGCRVSKPAQPRRSPRGAGWPPGSPRCAAGAPSRPPPPPASGLPPPFRTAPLQPLGTPPRERNEGGGPSKSGFSGPAPGRRAPLAAAPRRGGSTGRTGRGTSSPARLTHLS